MRRKESRYLSAILAISAVRVWLTAVLIYRHPETTNVDKFVDDLSACLTAFRPPKKRFTSKKIFLSNRR